MALNPSPAASADSSKKGVKSTQLYHSWGSIVGVVLIWLLACTVVICLLYPHQGMPELQNQALPEVIWIPIMFGSVVGLRWWQTNVNNKRSRGEQIPAKAVSLILVLTTVMIFSLYVMSRALWLHSGAVVPKALNANGGTAVFFAPTGALFVGVIWAMAASSLGGLVGFLFGVTRVTIGQGGQVANSTDADGKVITQPAAPMTVLENIAQWLSTAIAGGVLVQASNLGSFLEGLGKEFSNLQGLYGSPVTSENGWLALVGKSSAVFFTLFGFFSVYLITKLILVGALNAADGSGSQLPELLDLNSDERQQLEKSPVAVGDGMQDLSVIVTTVAKKIADVDVGALTDWRDLLLLGKAQLILGEFELAREAYRRCLAIVPDDAEARLGYAIALTYWENGGAKSDRPMRLRDSARRMILDQLEYARDSLNAFSPPDLRKNIYKSLTYSYLYLKAPEGFERTFACAREYYEKTTDPILSSGLLTNIACACGQAVGWLSLAPDQPIEAVRDKAWVLGQVPPQGADQVTLTKWLENEATRLIKQVLQRKPELKPTLRRMARLDPVTDVADVDNDLEPIQGALKDTLQTTPTLA